MTTKKFTHVDPAGIPWGITSAEHLWANVYAIKYNRPEKILDRAIWLDLLTKAKLAAIESGADTLGVRIRLEYEPKLFKGLFTELGFTRLAGRIEYQCKVADLPFTEGTPFIWKTAKELAWTSEEIADFTKEIVRNALDVDPSENPNDFIKDWLNNDELTHGPECIAIGFLDNKPCALVVAQVATSDGWSRIAYMGLVSEYREKCLGKWVHRHGFAMMKAQGGKLYHGGTHSENSAMRKLFESHGCPVFCEMEEWIYKPVEGQK